MQRLFVTRAGFDNLEDVLGNQIILMIMGIDTSEATELNGDSGAVEGTAGLRYVVMSVTPAGVPLEGEDPELWPVDETVVPHSSVVTLLGLMGAPELNGRRGVVVSIDHDAERYEVQLEAARVVKVRFRNALV